MAPSARLLVSPGRHGSSKDDSNRLEPLGDIVDVGPHCICRGPQREGDFMLGCDNCEEWFHGLCVGVDEIIKLYLKSYYCPRHSGLQNGRLILFEDEKNVADGENILQDSRVEAEQLASFNGDIEIEPKTVYAETSLENIARPEKFKVAVLEDESKRKRTRLRKNTLKNFAPRSMTSSARAKASKQKMSRNEQTSLAMFQKAKDARETDDASNGLSDSGSEYTPQPGTKSNRLKDSREEEEGEEYDGDISTAIEDTSAGMQHWEDSVFGTGRFFDEEKLKQLFAYRLVKQSMEAALFHSAEASQGTLVGDDQRT